MNPSNPSIFARPLFAFCLGITVLVAAAIYSSPTRAASFTLDVSDCSSFQLSGGPNYTLTCVKGTVTGGSPSCTITANTAPTTSAGGSVALSANCSNIASTSFAWVKGGSAIGSNSSTLNDTLPANAATSSVSYTYGLTACTTSTCAPTAWTTISVPAAGTTGGGVTGPVSCSGFNKTVYIDLAWVSTDASSRILTANKGGFNAKDALVVKLSPPAGSLSSGNGSITMAEYVDPRYSRLSTISTTPCDFTKSSDSSLYKASTTLSYKLTVGGTQQPYVPYLMPGVAYYLNVRNTDANGNQTCPTGASCNMYLDFYKPPGT